MRQLLIISFIAASLGISLFSTSLNADTYHVYVTGYVTTVNDSEIFVDQRRYIISPTVKVIFHERRNGSYYEVKGRLSDVRAGQPVIVKKEGSSVYEILIERWKQ